MTCDKYFQMCIQDTSIQDMSTLNNTAHLKTNSCFYGRNLLCVACLCSSCGCQNLTVINTV